MFPTKAPGEIRAGCPPPVQSHAIRETVESIVIAFVLAFLFRTFEAEAFVIPTGSMAPTLMGRHKDVVCPKCNYRYQVSASEEESEDPRHQTSDCIAGKCPMCQYVLPMRPMRVPTTTAAGRSCRRCSAKDDRHSAAALVQRRSDSGQQIYLFVQRSRSAGMSSCSSSPATRK